MYTHTCAQTFYWTVCVQSSSYFPILLLQVAGGGPERAEIFISPSKSNRNNNELTSTVSSLLLQKGIKIIVFYVGRHPNFFQVDFFIFQKKNEFLYQDGFVVLASFKRCLTNKTLSLYSIQNTFFLIEMVFENNETIPLKEDSVSEKKNETTVSINKTTDTENPHGESKVMSYFQRF